MSDSATIVQKLWNYCNVLRDDGLSYQDYLEQLTFLLFLKMADEQAKPPFNRPDIVPHGPMALLLRHQQRSEKL
jgi:type I restriction enzyme M protein